MGCQFTPSVLAAENGRALHRKFHPQVRHLHAMPLDRLILRVEIGRATVCCSLCRFCTCGCAGILQSAVTHAALQSATCVLTSTIILPLPQGSRECFAACCSCDCTSASLCDHPCAHNACSAWIDGPFECRLCAAIPFASTRAVPC